MAGVISSKQDLVARLRQHRADLRALGVRRLGLFESFVRDAVTNESDVDMLVEFEAGEKTFDHFMDLSFLLEDLLGRRVELVTLGALSPHLGPHILKEAEYVTVAD